MHLVLETSRHVRCIVRILIIIWRIIMRDFIKFSPHFWSDKQGKQIKKLGYEARILSTYLLTCANSTMVGIYYLPMPLIIHETEIPFKGVLKTLRSLEKINFCTYDTEHEYAWVYEMGFSQIDKQLKPKDNRIKYIHNIVNKLPNLSFLPKFMEKYQQSFHLDLLKKAQPPSKALQSKYKNKNKQKKKKNNNKQKAEPCLIELIANKKIF